MNTKKILLYILLSFGISWLSVLAMLLLKIPYGGLASTLIIALLYMPGPAIAVFVIQKFIYKERFRQYGWAFSFKNYKALLQVPFLYVVFMLLTFAVIALLGNTGLIGTFGTLDLSDEGFKEKLQSLILSKTGSDSISLPQIPAWAFLLISLGQGILAGITINLPFMFGEEFGWRGLMQKETQSMGFTRSSLLIGTIWGLWHAPIILLGHNYPHFPGIGVAIMCLFTISLSPVFNYVRIKTKSIVGPCMLHGMINATGSVFVLLVDDQHELYSSVAGVAGIIAGFLLFAGIRLFDKKFVMNYTLSDNESINKGN